MFNPFESGGSGGGGSIQPITIDSQVNKNSENPVQNKAIYSFVNSSVATNTANFIGTFSSISELENYTGEVTNNDYAFVRAIDEAGNTIYNRYKYKQSDNSWLFEYSLNNSSFTANQWSTINSGLTSTDKQKLNGIEANANKTVVDSSMSSTSTNPVQNKVINDALSGKQDVLTFDASPTQGSLNPVTSAGIYENQQKQEVEMGVIASMGAKNMLPLNVTSQVINGVSFDVDQENGTITVNADGTQTTNTFFYLVRNDSDFYSKILGKRLTLSGCPAGGSGSTYRLRCWHYDGTNIASDLGNEVTFEFTNSENNYDISIQIFPNAVCENVVFKPMLRNAAILDNTYSLYAPTNRELYSTIQAMTQAEYDALITKSAPLYFIYEEE